MWIRVKYLSPLYPVNPVLRMAYNVIAMVCMVSYANVVNGNIILLYSIDAHNF